MYKILLYSVLDDLSYKSNHAQPYISNINKFCQLLINVYGVDNLKDGIFRNYTNPPKASDIEIVAIAFASEAMGITSENLLFSNFKTDFPLCNETISDRSNFNRRRRKLQPFIDKTSEQISDRLSKSEHTFIIDSIPIPNNE